MCLARPRCLGAARAPEADEGPWPTAVIPRAVGPAEAVGQHTTQKKRDLLAALSAPHLFPSRRSNQK